MQKIFSSVQVKELDKQTITNEPIASIELMERASYACFQWLKKRFSRNQTFKIFIGPGNNGGDGLAIARMLANEQYRVEVFIITNKDRLSYDSSLNYNRLIEQNKVPVLQIDCEEKFPQINYDEIVIDCLFGSGLNKPLSGLTAQLVSYLNRQNSTRIAIDIPSGLFGEQNWHLGEQIVFKAHETLTFQFPFLSFLLADNASFIGNVHVIDIKLDKKTIDHTPTPYQIAEIHDIQLKIRSKYSHKGNYGHALLIGGSYGMMGAAFLSAKACLRSGAGLVTAHVPGCGFEILQTALPEVMLSEGKGKRLLDSIPNIDKYSAIAVGPGLRNGAHSKKLMKQLLLKVQQPLIIDADGLNTLAQHPELLKMIPTNSILTPHPGELDRLAGKCSGTFERLEKAKVIASKYNIVILLKGANSCTVTPEGTYIFNPTGNPGMATAGSGDVLTGIILSLLAQGYNSVDASVFGAFIHGLAGDKACQQQGAESLIATDIIENLKLAFQQIHLQFQP